MATNSSRSADIKSSTSKTPKTMISQVNLIMKSPGEVCAPQVTQILIMKPTPAVDNSPKKSNETFEAGQKLEALREKRAQQDQEKWQKWQEEREVERERMEIDKKRREEQRERRKREQEEVEQQLKLFEEQRREREEEEARRMEEYERKRQADDQHLASTFRVTSMINAVSLAAMKARQGNSHVKSKKDVIAEKVPPLDISDDTSTEELKKMVELLRGKLETVRGEIFDLMQKTEKQDYFINELDQRIMDMNKDSSKPKPVLMIGSGIVSRMKDKGLESLQKEQYEKYLREKKGESCKIEQIFESKLGDASFTPKPKNPSLEVSIGVSQRMNQLQANLEADAKKEPKKIAVKQTYQLADAIMSGKDVDTRKEYEAQKEARRKKHEEEVAELNRLREEYQKRKEADERAEEEARKRDMEKNNNTIVVNGQEKHGSKGGLSQREEEIRKRVPPLEVSSNTSEEELRELASELIELLKEVYGDIFDLKMVKNHLDKEFQDLEREVQEESKNISVFIPVEGKVKQRKEEAWQKSRFQESSAKPKPGSKEVIKTGSVKNRLAMFENGKK